MSRLYPSVHDACFRPLNRNDRHGWPNITFHQHMPVDMDEGTAQPLFSPASVVGGLVAGSLHAGLVMLLWEYVSSYSPWHLLVTGPAFGLYLLLGWVLPGFVPAVLYIAHKRRLPVAIVGVVLIVVVLGSWTIGPPGGAFAGPTLFGMYLFAWAPIVGVAALAGSLEPKMTRRLPG